MTLILSLIPMAVCIGVFFIVRAWMVKQPDQLVARHRVLGVLIWVFALLLVAMTISRFVSTEPPRQFAVFAGLMLVFAIIQRQRLSQELHKR